MKKLFSVLNARGQYGLNPVFSVLAALALVATGCSQNNEEARSERVPELSFSVENSGAVGQVPLVGHDPGFKANVVRIGKTRFIEAEAIFSEREFNRIGLETDGKEAALKEVTAALKSRGAMVSRAEPDFGYVKFLSPVHGQNVFGALKDLGLGRELLIAPSLYDVSSLKDAKAFKPSDLGLAPSTLAVSESYSGLVRIGAPDFVALAEADINSGSAAGVTVDGSATKVGITDTGISLHHPTFYSQKDKTKNRVQYMKDFTKEGRVYIRPDAAFQAKELSTSQGVTELEITASVIKTPRNPNVPTADDGVAVGPIKVKVAEALKARVLDPAQGVKLAYLIEDAFQGSDTAAPEPVDLNGNGKLTDEIPILYLPGADRAKDELLVDFSAKNDFTKAALLKDFNSSKLTAKVFAERIGFQIGDDVLLKKNADELPDDQKSVAVIGLSIVGFDPGNHGTHVGGIAAGSKTIINLPDDTLARGVAPEAEVLLNRVCANNGGCNAAEAFLDLSKTGVDVSNMSLGGLNPLNDGFGVQETLINRVTSTRNVLFVISAGNSGPGRQTVGSPSVARLSLSVGASASVGLIQNQYLWPGAGEVVTPAMDHDLMLFFSSRGPTAAGGFKPNLSAPGTELSSIQLNAAPGSHAGLDVYWGTSMAAPTATGAYALLLDAVRKFNVAHPTKKLSTDAVELRQVLISTAVPFDVTKKNLVTGDETSGQYTWSDQGTGLLYLPAAWKKLFALRDQRPPTAVQSSAGDVELDYQVIVESKFSPAGFAYDGSRPTQAGPAFGTGVYLDPAVPETLIPVHISRKLPEKYAASPELGDLTRALSTSADEFEIETEIYGSHSDWLKAGTLSALGCQGSLASGLTLLSLGATVSVAADGTGAVQAQKGSILNLCLDRTKVDQLVPGDHGALVHAYRVVRTSGQSKRAAVPSFTVPVFMTVPHRVLETSTGFEVSKKVKSFGVDRHYVRVPKGTSLVTITVEVPEIKAGSATACSGVELMALIGDNSTKAIEARKDARAANCSPTGAPVVGVSQNGVRRTVLVAKDSPTPGLWDVHIFGSYAFVESEYKLSVQYVTAKASLAQIAGDLSALQGSFDWTVAEASIQAVPDAQKSKFSLNGHFLEIKSALKTGDRVILDAGLGKMRVYPDIAKKVVVTTGGSSGNDIDLSVIECDATAADTSDASCETHKTSAGSTDVEKVEYTPKQGKAYAILVDGYEMNDAGNYVATETVVSAAEPGLLSISGGLPTFHIGYDFSAAAIAASSLIHHDLVKTKGYEVSGAVELRLQNDGLLERIPVRIRVP